GLLLARNDVLLFDEPTNHLDFETVESFGKALKAFHGTVFFISHDRTFVNMLATQIVEVSNGAVLRYPGDYEEYVYSMEARIREELSEDKPAKTKPAAHKKKAGLDRMVVKQLKAEMMQVNSNIRGIQARFERHKKEHTQIHQTFATDPSSWSIERNLRYEYLGKVIREEEDLWLELMEKAEALSKKIDACNGGASIPME
ncbi:MAG: hypothetical protein Q8R48_07815, partial [Candidatus Omnitrophota bacterium]|nr:hypothetical protein [Candidatus Omnitrophota bacterium]